MAAYCVTDAVLGAWDTVGKPNSHRLLSVKQRRQTINTQILITCDQNNNGNTQGDRMERTRCGRVHLYRVSGKASLRR